MNQELKSKWVEALRSGKYKQGMYDLRQRADDGYVHCCLGVLCELSPPQNPPGEMEWFHYGDRPFNRQWPGIALDYEMAEILANMNDGGKSFAEIADYIEKEIPCS